MKRKPQSVQSIYYNPKALEYGIAEYRLEDSLALLKNITGKRILDIGCATGYVGKILKNQNNYVVGIDISEKAVAKAKRVLDAAYALNIETDSLSYLTKFDLIIFLGTIEHLFDPAKTLKKISSLLKSNGLLLVTTPNIVYWGYRWQFLKGDFRYTNQGVFDESHIHFFTYFTLKELIIETGFEIVAENHSTGGVIGKLLVKQFPNIFAEHLIFLVRKI